MQFNSVNKKIVTVFLFCFGDYFPFPWACAHISAPSTKQPLCLGVLEGHICTDAESGPQRRQLSPVDNHGETSTLWSEVRNSDPGWQPPWAGVHHTCERKCRWSQCGFLPGWRGLEGRGSQVRTFGDVHTANVWDDKGDRGHAWTRRAQILRATHQKTRSPSRGGAGWGGERGGPHCSLWGAISKFTPKTVPHQGADLRG